MPSVSGCAVRAASQPAGVRICPAHPRARRSLSGRVSSGTVSSGTVSSSTVSSGTSFVGHGFVEHRFVGRLLIDMRPVVQRIVGRGRVGHQVFLDQVSRPGHPRPAGHPRRRHRGRRPDEPPRRGRGSGTSNLCHLPGHRAATGQTRNGDRDDPDLRHDHRTDQQRWRPDRRPTAIPDATSRDCRRDGNQGAGEHRSQTRSEQPIGPDGQRLDHRAGDQISGDGGHGKERQPDPGPAEVVRRRGQQRHPGQINRRGRQWRVGAGTNLEADPADVAHPGDHRIGHVRDPEHRHAEAIGPRRRRNRRDADGGPEVRDAAPPIGPCRRRQSAPTGRSIAPRTPSRSQVADTSVHQSCHADPRRHIPAAVETRASPHAVHTQPAGTAPAVARPRVVIATMRP